VKSKKIATIAITSLIVLLIVPFLLAILLVGYDVFWSWWWNAFGQ
jgi:hypothetical protein